MRNSLKTTTSLWHLVVPLILDKNATPIYSVQLDPADIQAINQSISRPSCARCELLYL